MCVCVNERERERESVRDVYLLRLIESSSVKKVTARPARPARPVLPVFVTINKNFTYRAYTDTSTKTLLYMGVENY